MTQPVMRAVALAAVLITAGAGSALGASGSALPDRDYQSLTGLTTLVAHGNGPQSTVVNVPSGVRGSDDCVLTDSVQVRGTAAFVIVTLTPLADGGEGG